MTARLGLGTVQFGLAYGVANSLGRPSDTAVRAILAAAAEDDCALFDTAAAYGDSEAVLGRLRSGAETPIVSKLPAVGAGTDVDAVPALVSEAIGHSLQLLRVPSLYGYLVHHADDLIGPLGLPILAALRIAKAAGQVARIGVSIYDGAQLDAILKLFVPDIVQLPLNIVDRRLLDSGHLARLKAAGTEIHVRSAYLQGVLQMQPDRLPIHLRRLAPRIEMLDQRCRSAGVSRSQAALRFLLDLPEVDVVVVGAQTDAEWADSSAAARISTRIATDGLACDDLELIDPRRWPRT